MSATAHARLNVDPIQLGQFVDVMFRYADEGTFASLRTFYELKEAPPIDICGVQINGNAEAFERLVVGRANLAANYAQPSVFCPPLATFTNRKRAREVDLANGLVLSLELDKHAERSRQRLELLFGRATVVVASGGEWIDPETGEVQAKLHLHWRLSEPTRTPEDHARLKEARTRATRLVGGDVSNKPIVHPLRWPGSWHRKAEPKLCRIVALNPDAELELQDALEALIDATPEFSARTGASQGAYDPDDDRETSELVRRIVTGDEYHSALRDLSWRFLKAEMKPAQVVITLRGLMDASTGPRDDRWQARRDQIPMLVRTAEEKIGAEETTNVRSWPDPSPLPEGRPSVAAFDMMMLPQRLQPWVADLCDRLQIPPDFPSAALLIMAGALIGRQVGIRPKRHDTWTVIPNLFGMLIGGPGLLKTPAQREAIATIYALEDVARANHQEAMREYDAKAKVHGIAAKLADKEMEKKLRDGKTAKDDLIRQLVEGEETPGEPARKRYLTNDPSIEKLGELLRDNPAGVLLFRDELMGLLRGMERDGHQQDRAFFLEAWDGGGRFTYDRITRGTVEIDSACVSILGAVCPGPLSAWIAGCAASGNGDDGMLQRFQITVWPDNPGDFVNVDRVPDPDAEEKRREAIEPLAEVGSKITTPESVKLGRGGETALSTRIVRFDPEAQALFDAWRTRLERRLRTADMIPAWESYLGKHRSLLPTIALICHLIEGHRGNVGAAAWMRAEAWGEYLESHARRLYDAFLRPHATSAQALGAKILTGALASPFHLRDVYRPQWASLTTIDEAALAVEALIDAGWLAAEEVRGPVGRPTVCYHINPKCKGLAK
jgi:uncharacterized protein DUF3987